MSLWYDSDTDTVIKDSEDTQAPRDEDWRERGGKGTYDSADFSPPETLPPPTQLPDEAEPLESGDTATRYSTDVINRLKELHPDWSLKDVGDAGIRITHHLGAEQGLTAKELLDTLGEMSDDEIRGMVDKTALDLTTRDPKGNIGFDFGRDYMQELYAPRPDSSKSYGIGEKPPSASGLSPAAPAPASFAAIRHDPDLLDRYYRALNIYHDALGRGLTDAERQKLADTITRGGLWKELDELRARQEKAAAEYFSPKAPPAEDYWLRHPELLSNVAYNPSPPQWGSPTLTLSPRPATDQSQWAGSTGKSDTLGIPNPASKTVPDGRPALFQLIDTIKQFKGSAKDAMQHVFDLTYGGAFVDPSLGLGLGGIADDLLGRVVHSNFRDLGASKGDSGFQLPFKDDYMYRDQWGFTDFPHTTQLGHFLTAVDMGYNGWDRFEGAMVKHEQIPDTDWKGLKPAAEAFLFPASAEDVAAFNRAIVYDMQGDSKSRDDILRTILREDPEKHMKGRQGNSLEDLRLSVKGWELGREIALGSLKTSEDVADWIARNIAEGYY